jgi:hypothetical protein
METDSNMKQSSEVNLTQGEAILIIQSLEEKEKKHAGLAKMTRNSGYGAGNQKESTIQKAEVHKEKAEECRLLLSKIGECFI